MKNQCKSPNPLLFEAFPSLVSVLAVSLLSAFVPSMAQPVREADLPQEREIHNTFSSGQGKGSLIEATNPMDLINRLRQATAMDNATTPSDAIDDALKLFDEKELNSQTSELRPPATKSPMRKSL